MADNQKTAGVRRRVVESAKEKLKSERVDLPDQFLEEWDRLLGSSPVPKADALLALFEKQVGGDA